MAKLPNYKAKEFDERLAALEALEKMPKELLDDLDQFMEFVNDPAADCNCKRLEGMKFKFACKKALKAVAELGDEAVAAIMSRANLLKEIGIKMLSAVPVEMAQKWMQSNLISSDEAVRQQAVEILERLAIDFTGKLALMTGGGVLSKVVKGPPKKPALLVALAKDDFDLLAKVTTKDENWFIRSKTARALGAVEPSSDIVDLLITAAKDEEESVRHAAIRSLGYFKEGAAKAVPTLVKALKSADDLVAADTLREIGSAAKEAIPALKEMAKRSDPAGKDKAKMAISVIKKG